MMSRVLVESSGNEACVQVNVQADSGNSDEGSDVDDDLEQGADPSIAGSSYE
jgi:hypothetical protein